jgi:hypothetical protein
MRTKDFTEWYGSLGKEEQQLVNGLIILSVTTPVEVNGNTVGELRMHVKDCFDNMRAAEKK